MHDTYISFINLPAFRPRVHSAMLSLSVLLVLINMLPLRLLFVSIQGRPVVGLS